MFEEIPRRGHFRRVSSKLQTLNLPRLYLPEPSSPKPTLRGLDPAHRVGHGVGHRVGRRVVLGPFVVGGGVALATLGGSVAVAATVITASTIRIVDHGPSHDRHVVASAATANRAAARTVQSGAAAHRHQQLQPGSGSSRSTSALPGGPHGSAGIVAPPAPTRPAGQSPSSQAGATTKASPTSGPAGNAVIFLDGYESAGSSLLFRYATVTPGAGPNGSDVYSTSGSAEQYRTRLAAGAPITSGDTICPPAGNHCTPAQLFAATSEGVYAEVAVDARGLLESVIERDNVQGSAAATLTPSPSATSSTSAGSPPSSAGTGSAAG